MYTVLSCSIDNCIDVFCIVQVQLHSHADVTASQATSADLSQFQQAAAAQLQSFSILQSLNCKLLKWFCSGKGVEGGVGKGM
jgi:hypothetical protein